MRLGHGKHVHKNLLVGTLGLMVNEINKILHGIINTGVEIMRLAQEVIDYVQRHIQRYDSVISIEAGHADLTIAQNPFSASF
jgi:hypothetical protein